MSDSESDNEYFYSTTSDGRVYDDSDPTRPSKLVTVNKPKPKLFLISKITPVQNKPLTKVIVKQEPMEVEEQDLEQEEEEQNEEIQVIYDDEPLPKLIDHPKDEDIPFAKLFPVVNKRKYEDIIVPKKIVDVEEGEVEEPKVDPKAIARAKKQIEERKKQPIQTIVPKTPVTQLPKPPAKAMLSDELKARIEELNKSKKKEKKKDTKSQNSKQNSDKDNKNKKQKNKEPLEKKQKKELQVVEDTDQDSILGSASPLIIRKGVTAQPPQAKQRVEVELFTTLYDKIWEGASTKEIKALLKDRYQLKYKDKVRSLVDGIVYLTKLQHKEKKIFSPTHVTNSATKK